MTDSTSSSVSSLIVGIDVAKAKLDLGRSDSKSLLTVDYDIDGVNRIVQELRAARPILIVVESTGGLERFLTDALLDAGLPVALVNPKHVRHLAKGLGILAKTDKIDAFVLIQFGRLASPRLMVKRTKNEVELQALVVCRRQLTHVKTEQTNRLKTTTSKPATNAIESVLATIEKQIEKLNQQIRKLIESDDDFNSIDKLLQSVPGIGDVSSSTMLAELNELGSTDHKSISALIGVAPFNHDSGLLKGKRSICGGRASVRSALYMATVTATWANPVIKAFYERLQKAGKLKKVAIVACMNKLAGLLNAMIRDNLYWNQLNAVKALEI